MNNNFNILGISINSSRKDEVLQFLHDHMNAEISAHIITLNLDHLRIAMGNPDYYKICCAAELVIADGIGVTSLVKKKYGTKIKRLTGNDILQMLLSIAEIKNKKIAIIGGNPKYQNQLMEKINTQFSISDNNLYVECPKMSFEKDETENQRVISQIKLFQPDILIVGLGCPRQEFWIRTNKNAIGAKINVGVGAAIDFYSGTQTRSPEFLQKIGMEWLWRLLTEPKRLFKRYVLKGIPFYIKTLSKL